MPSLRSSCYGRQIIWHTSSASETQSAVHEVVQQLGSWDGEQTALTQVLQLVHCRGPTVQGSWQLHGGWVVVVVVVARVVVVVIGA